MGVRGSHNHNHIIQDFVMIHHDTDISICFDKKKLRVIKMVPNRHQTLVQKLTKTVTALLSAHAGLSLDLTVEPFE